MTSRDDEKDLRSVSGVDYVPPESPHELAVVAAFQELLGVERVGLNDDFFDLGGRSLVGIEIWNRLNATFDVRLPLRDFMERSNVKALASRFAELERLKQEGHSDGAAGAIAEPLLVRRDRAEALPLSDVEVTFWFLEQMNPSSIDYVLGATWKLEGALEIDTLRQAFQRLSERHESLRTRYSIDGLGRPLRIIDPPPSEPFKLESQPLRASDVTGDARWIAAARQASASSKGFSIANEHLFRASLVQLSETEHVLGVAIHHIISDAWSLSVFARDLFELYRSISTGTPSKLPELRVQYGDVAAWYHERHKVKILSRQLDYWKQHLAGAPLAYEFNDRVRPKQMSLRGGHHLVDLDEEFTGGLLELCRREQSTLTILFQVAFGVVVSDMTGLKDFFLGTVAATRQRAELENLFGPMFTILPYRLRFTENPTCSELLARFKTSLLDGLENADVPSEQMVRGFLGRKRDPARPTFFQAVINVMRAEATLSIGGLQVNRFSAPALEEKTVAELEIYVYHSATRLRLFTTYAKDLFDHGKVVQSVARVQSVLRRMAAAPSASQITLQDLFDAARSTPSS